MRKIFYIAAAMAGCVACSDLESINQDPNNATETNPRLLLTNVCWEAFSENSTTPLYASKMLVQSDGESVHQYYKWDRGSFGYYSNMRNVEKMKQEAEKISDMGYVALAHFFRAHYFMKLTLNFGDVPYTQALRGEYEGIYQPAYDSQREVFTGILNELEKASDILDSYNSLINGDIIYNGDVTKWRKLVNAYRLKVLISLSNKEKTGDVDIAAEFAKIVAGGNLLSGNSDNGQVVFLDQEGNRYPQFNSSSFGSGMYMDQTFVSLLKDRRDPRLFSFCTQTKNAKEAGLDITDFNSYGGGDPAAPYSETNDKAVAGNISKVNERYYSEPTNEPQILLGYSEQQFILAEACVRGWIPGNASEYYKQGVRSSFSFYRDNAKEYTDYLSGETVEEYLDQELISIDSAAGDEEKIARIITQKYIQSFFQGMWGAYFEHLRTGYPEFRRPLGVDVPFRWMYPLGEYNNNKDNVEIAISSQFSGEDKISSKPWWLK